jgi:hypothetical protein
MQNSGEQSCSIQASEDGLALALAAWDLQSGQGARAPRFGPPYYIQHARVLSRLNAVGSRCFPSVSTVDQLIIRSKQVTLPLHWMQNTSTQPNTVPDRLLAYTCSHMLCNRLIDDGAAANRCLLRKTSWPQQPSYSLLPHIQRCSGILHHAAAAASCIQRGSPHHWGNGLKANNLTGTATTLFPWHWC